SRSELPPPTAGSVWHRAQDVSLKTGPRPSSGVSSDSNSSFPAAKRASSAPLSPGSGSPARACSDVRNDVLADVRSRSASGSAGSGPTDPVPQPALPTISANATVLDL